MWRLIQYLIFSAVVVSNAKWEWTPNAYLAGWIGIALAFIVTVVAVRVADMLRGSLVGEHKKRPTVPFSKLVQ